MFGKVINGLLGFILLDLGMLPPLPSDRLDKPPARQRFPAGDKEQLVAPHRFRQKMGVFFQVWLSGARRMGEIEPLFFEFRRCSRLARPEPEGNAGIRLDAKIHLVLIVGLAGTKTGRRMSEEIVFLASECLEVHRYWAMDGRG